MQRNQAKMSESMIYQEVRMFLTLSEDKQKKLRKF
jgi:hypothetical protein